MIKKITIFIIVILILLIFYFAYNYFTKLMARTPTAEFGRNQPLGQQKISNFQGPSGPPSARGPSGLPPK